MARTTDPESVARRVDLVMLLLAVTFGLVGVVVLLALGGHRGPGRAAGLILLVVCVSFGLPSGLGLLRRYRWARVLYALCALAAAIACASLGVVGLRMAGPTRWAAVLIGVLSLPLVLFEAARLVQTLKSRPPPTAR